MVRVKVGVFLIFVFLFSGVTMMAGDKVNKDVEQLLNNGKTNEAVKILKEAISSDKTDYSSRLNLGNIYLSLGDIERAEKLYDQAFDLQQDSPLLWNNMGLIYLQKNQVEKAVEHFVTALKLDPTFQDANLNMAELQFLYHKYDDAFIFARNALHQGDKDAKVFFMLGKIERARGQFRKAASNFAQAIAVNSQFVEAKLELGLTIIQLGEYSHAQSIFRDILQNNSDMPYAHYGLGASAYFLEDYSLAEKALKKATKMDPSLVDGYIYLGLVNKKKGDLQKAKNFFIVCLEFAPKHENALLQLAMVEDELQDFGAAMGHYQEVLGVNQKNYKALMNLGILHERKKEYDIAKELYILALQAAPNNSLYQNSIKLNLAGVYQELGEKKTVSLLLDDVLKSEEKGSPRYKAAMEMRSN